MKFRSVLNANVGIIVLIAGIILFLFLMSASVGIAGYVWLNQPSQEELAADLDLSSYSSSAADQPAADGDVIADPLGSAEVAEISPAGQVLPGGQTFTTNSILPELPTSYYADRLSQNVSQSDVPSLSHDGGADRGPQRVQFIVSENGSLHDHTLGQAEFVDTEIIGAAGEWQVRPWWQPAWVPQSVDCGEEGTVAIGGHVSWATRPGPFYDLGAMTAGDRIRCQSTGGSWFTYEVSEVVQVGYNDTEHYWSSRSDLNDHQLTLFSCKPEITGIIVVRAQIVGG